MQDGSGALFFPLWLVNIRAAVVLTFCALWVGGVRGVAVCEGALKHSVVYV